MAVSYQFNPFTGNFDLVTTFATPTLQEVTTAGATSNVQTTFTGGLISEDSGNKSFRYGLGSRATADLSGVVGYNVNALVADSPGGNNYGFGAEMDLKGSFMLGLGNTLVFDQFNTNARGTLIGANSTLRCEVDNLGAAAGINIGLGNSSNSYGSAVVGVDNTIGSGTETTLDTYQGNVVILGNVNTIPESVGSAGNHFIFGNNNAVSSGSILGTGTFGYSNSVGHDDAFVFGHGITSSAANEHTFGGTTALYRFQGTFPDNNTLKFGTGADAAIFYDATNLVINPTVAGAGVLFVGDGTTGGHFKAGLAALGDSSINTGRLLNMDVTGSTVIRGLSCVLDYTGTTPTLRSMSFDVIHNGSSATGAKAPVAGLFQSTLGTDTTGTVNVTGLNGIARTSIALANTSGAGSYNFQNTFVVNSVGGNTTTQPIHARSVWAQEPGAFTGAAGVLNRWAILCAGAFQINNDKKLFLGGTDTTQIDTYLIRNLATTDVDIFIDGVKTQTWDNDLVETFVPFKVAGVTLGTVVDTITTPATNDDPVEFTQQNRVATTDATVTTLDTYTIPATTTVLISTRVVARRTGGAAGTAEDGAGYEFITTVKNIAGAATIIGAVAAISTQEDQAAWNATHDVNAATVRVRVTGAANNDVTWHSTSKIYQVGS